MIKKSRMYKNIKNIGKEVSWHGVTLLRCIIIMVLMARAVDGVSQEVSFFSEGTSASYYDQGIVDVANLGGSTFEHTYPPGGPQWNDKIPCSTLSYSGLTSLKFEYASALTGNWKATIYRSDWSTANITAMDSISFYLFSQQAFPQTALPKIGIKTTGLNGSGEVLSDLYQLSDYNSNVEINQWNRITFPISVFIKENKLNLTSVKGIIFNQSETNNISRQIFIDEILAFKSIDTIPGVINLTAKGYDSHAELIWDFPMEDLNYQIYASFDGGESYELRGETKENFYLDFVPEKGKNQNLIYRIYSTAQGKTSIAAETQASIHDFTDDELLDMFQQYTFRYFWEGAHQVSGLPLERSNSGPTTVASGATGMGLLAMIAAYEREWKPRAEIKERILSILRFLELCEHHHGAFSHWYDAETYKTKPFSEKDDGGDIVETAYLAEGLLAIKNYFTEADSVSTQIREKAEALWRGIEWDWYRNNDQNTIYWHWSPKYAFGMNMKVSGWNECFVTYIMAASSPTHTIPKIVYDNGWARNGNMVKKRTYYNIPISLSPDYGGPLFWLHYSFMGINPTGLKDKYADYWTEHVNTVKIHHAYSVLNPKKHKNYSDKCWGLTASDDPSGYTAHQPMSNDNGTISPTAALASFPYTPEESMKALKYFYRERGAELFGKYGPYDAFNDNLSWVRKAYIGIDQGPIVVMIENYRSGLLWNLVMNDSDVINGLTKLGFDSQTTTSSMNIKRNPQLKLSPASDGSVIEITLPEYDQQYQVLVNVYTADGKLIKSTHYNTNKFTLPVYAICASNNMYLLSIENGTKVWNTKFVCRK